METIPGYAYVVTAAADVTVTDSHGLVLEVPAGEQRTFVASTGEVSASGDCTIVQVRGNFSLPPSGAGGGYPAAPVPEALTPTTAMRNGGVYTVAAAGTGLDFSAVTIGVNATARIWLDYENATDVEWPHGWVWLTEDGLQPEFALFKRFKLEIENDAVATTAKVADSYPYALEYTHTVLTSTNYADDELELFLVPGETENPAYTNNAWAMFNHSGSSLGYYAADWTSVKNMLGEDLPVVVESAPPPPFEHRRWCVCTFRTSAPVDFAGLAAANLGGMAIHIVLQAWNDGGWVTCGAAAMDVQKTDALHVINHVTTDKWRLLISSSKAETFVGKVRLFVNR